MVISSFSRINTRIRPGAELAVIHISDSVDSPVPPEDVNRELESMRHSIDGVAIVGIDCDPLAHADLYRILKTARPRGIEVTVVTSGCSSANLDDLVGAGYIGFMALEVRAPLDPEQMRCIDVMRDNGRDYMVTVTVAKDVFDEDSLRTLCRNVSDARHVIIKNAGGKDALAQKDLLSLTKPSKGLVRDLRIV